MVWQYIIPAAASLLGGAMSNRTNRSMAADQAALQKEFAQNGIRWRVADAKAAGLHPLYALGAQLPSYSPVSVQDSMGPALAEAGQHVGRAIQATQTQAERTMTELLIEKTRSEIAETDARRDYFISLAATGGQGALQTKPLPEIDVESSPLQGLTDLKPTETPTHSSDSSATQAGVAPMWREFEIYPGRKLTLPGDSSGNPSESLEALTESPVMMWMVYKENARRYGPEWETWFLEEYLGVPEYIHSPQKWGKEWARKHGKTPSGWLRELLDRARARGAEARRHTEEMRRNPGYYP